MAIPKPSLNTNPNIMTVPPSVETPSATVSAVPPRFSGNPRLV